MLPVELEVEQQLDGRQMNMLFLNCNFAGARCKPRVTLRLLPARLARQRPAAISTVLLKVTCWIMLSSEYSFPSPLITTNICFGGRDMRKAYITLSYAGQLVEMDWPRPELRLNDHLARAAHSAA